MAYVLGALLIVLTVASVSAVLMRRTTLVTWFIFATILYVPSYFIWFAAQFLQVVPVDALLSRTFGVESHQLVDTPLGAVVQFGPPLVPSLALLCWMLRRRRNRARSA